LESTFVGRRVASDSGSALLAKEEVDHLTFALTGKIARRSELGEITALLDVGSAFAAGDEGEGEGAAEASSSAPEADAGAALVETTTEDVADGVSTAGEVTAVVVASTMRSVAVLGTELEAASAPDDPLAAQERRLGTVRGCPAACILA
jgi:hypothetical protein